MTSKATLASWHSAQTTKRETAAAKNDLESYIISTRESLETNEVLMKVGERHGGVWKGNAEVGKGSAEGPEGQETPGYLFPHV